MKREAYHHGDLRAALIEAGLELLAKRDADDLALREVARAVGVSPTAVYRHFPDKGALRAGLAAEGLKRLAEAQRAASDAVGGGAEGFSATGRAYVRFALANPALFRLIFSSPAATDLLGAADGDIPAPVALLRANAAALAPPGADEAAIKAVALQAWAVAHGLAMLMLDGQVPADDVLIDAAISKAARH